MALTGAFGLNFAAGQFFAPLTEARGWSLSTLTVAAALNAVVSGLAQPILGGLVDRHGPRPVIASCLTLMGAAYVLMASASSLWLWMVAYGLLAGVGFAGASSLAVTVLLSRWYVRHRARVLPRVFLGINAGQLTLVPVGGFLIERAGYRTAYLVLGVAVLVAMVPLVALGVVNRPDDVGQHADGGRYPPTAPGRRTLRSDALRSRAFWLPTLAFGVNGWTLYFTLLHLPRYARDLGGGLSAGGRLLAIAAVASALGLLAVSRLAPRWGKRRLVVALFWWRAAALGGAALATSTGHLTLVAVAFGAASFAVIPLVTGLIGDRYGTETLGSLLGVVFVVHQVGGGLGVLAGGGLRVVTGSYDPGLLLAAALLLAASALLLVPDERRDPAPAAAPSPATPAYEGTIP